MITVGCTLLNVSVHTVTGIDSTHAGDIRWLHVPCLGRRRRLGVCPVLYTASASDCNLEDHSSQGPTIQGMQHQLMTVFVCSLSMCCRRYSSLLTTAVHWKFQLFHRCTDRHTGCGKKAAPWFFAFFSATAWNFSWNFTRLFSRTQGSWWRRWWLLLLGRPT